MLGLAGFFWEVSVCLSVCLSCYAPNLRELKIRVNILNHNGNNVPNIMCTFESLDFAQHCIYVFLIVLTTDSEQYPKHRVQVGLCYGYFGCLL